MKNLLSFVTVFFLWTVSIASDKQAHYITPIPRTLSPMVPHLITDSVRASMPSLATAVFVTRYNHKKNKGEILLGKLKPPFSGWTIPEKAIISGELFVQASQTAVLEQTGLHVDIFGPTTFIQLPHTRLEDNKKVDVLYLVHLAKEIIPSQHKDDSLLSEGLCEKWQWFDAENTPADSGSQIVIPPILEYVCKHILR